MNRIVTSLLAVAAFGATVAGSQNAEAEGWIFSGWYGLNSSGHLGDGNNDEGFSISFYIGPRVAQAGTTLSGPNTGLVSVPGATNSACSAGKCPTTHWALELCQNGEFISGNIVEATTSGGSATTSYSNNNTSFGSGIWTSTPSGWTSQGADTGFCPSSTAPSAGGALLYQY